MFNIINNILITVFSVLVHNIQVLHVLLLAYRYTYIPLTKPPISTKDNYIF